MIELQKKGREMQVTFIPSQEINSDIGVVNAARVSLNKKSHYYTVYAQDQKTILETNKLLSPDIKLIHFLAQHNHWTPFAHSRLYFDISMTDTDLAYFLLNTQQRGFEIVQDDTIYIKGSVYAWVHATQYVPSRCKDFILDHLHKAYPVSLRAFNPNYEYPSFAYATHCIHMTEDYVIQHKWWKLACATLLIKVPVFVARQIRTSQVGFAYSDLYVEGESFVYNEVSRRYVNEEPEFYLVDQWRVREGKGVKQGSTGIACQSLQEKFTYLQDTVTLGGLSDYTEAEKYHIAPEQARALLPQSMYTEYYMTGTLHRWAQFLALRLKPDVQLETRLIAAQIASALRQQYPAWAEAYGIAEMAQEAV